ncbi:MAG: hypothetical protein LBM71_05660 [Elusimicrobiota bacterium]|nr:hypothetical protein [Elusimicrobiota bacterium]
MILSDIYSYLLSSEVLKTALEFSEEDTKIYPNYSRLSSRVPYLVYRSTNPGGTSDEVLSSEQLSLIITADSFLQVVEISLILTELLDLSDNKIPSAVYNIYYSKKIGGNDYVDELGRHTRVLNFILKFKKQ